MTELTHTDPLGCPGSGRLRTHLDHPDAAVEAHLDGCEECRDTILTIADDAGTVRRLLAVLDSPAVFDSPAVLDSPAVDAPTAASGRPSRAPVGAIGASVAPGRGRPRSRRSSRPGSRADTGRHAGRTRPRRVVLAVAGGLLTVAIAVTPFGSGALAQFLDTFRSERVQVIEVDVAALQDLDALDDIATVELTGDGALHDGPTEVADAAAALAIAGVAAPDLPAGVAGPDATVTHLAIAPSHAVVTLVATADNGVPADLDGAVLDVTVPGGAATVVTAASGMPDVILGVAGAIEATATGAPLADIRDFLLSREELPESLRTQLAGIEDWQTTLPLPVPAGGVGWEEVTVDGNDGLAFGDDSGLGAAIVWQADGLIHGIAGTRPLDELQALAEQA